MSKFKRALSLLLCLVMLFSTVSVAASLVSAEDATATAGVSSVKSYSKLASEKKEFIYLATEVYEPNADGDYELTDYYVDPGMKLKVRVFLKTDLYIGSGTVGFVHDNRVFDITNGTNGYEAAVAGVSNNENADVANNGVGVTFNSMMLSNSNVYKAGKLALPNKVVGDYTVTQADVSTHYTGYKRDTSSTYCYEFNEDEYFYEYYITVREDLANGTKGLMWADPNTYSIYKTTNPSAGTGNAPFDVRTSTDSGTRATACKMLSATGYTLDNFLIEDAEHMFTIGSATPKNVNFVLPVYAEDGSIESYKPYTYEATGEEGDEGYIPAFEGVFSDLTNTDVVLPTNPELDGYAFKGWGLAETDENGNITSFSSTGATAIKVGDADATYVAIFTQNPTYEVTYVYDVNGEETAFGATEKFEEGETYTVKAEYPAKEGYNFLGWSTAENDAEKIVAGEQTMGKEAVKYYAVYELGKYNVVFNANGLGAKFSASGEQTYTVSADFGSTVTAENVKDTPVRAGYVFNGWATEKAATEGIATSELSIVVPAKATYLYATWKPEAYTVKAYYSKEAYEANATPDETITLEAGATFKLAKDFVAPDGYRFVKWINAETGETFSTSKNAGVGAYKLGNATIYPEVTKLPYSVTYKVWDYNTNAWVTLKSDYTEKAEYTIKDFNDVRATIDPADIAPEGVELAHPFAMINDDGTPNNGLISTYAGMSFSDKDYADKADIAYGKTTYVLEDGKRVPQTLINLADEDVADDITIYIYTKVKFNITDTRDAFDENGKWLGEKETVTKTFYPTAANYHQMEISRIVDKATLVSPDEDYKFINFTDGNGNEIVPVDETDTTYTLALSAKNGSNITINTNFGPKTYVFYFQTEGLNNIICTAEAYKLGDKFDPATAKFIYLNTGKEAVLPKIGVAAEDQATPIDSMAGHKLVGWEFQRITGKNIKFPVEITKDFLGSTVYGGEEVIRIAAMWEAMPYKANFYYEVNGKETLLTSMMVKVGTPLEQFAPMDKETLAKLNAAAPEGKTFLRWAPKDGSNETGMIIGGRDYIAVYTTMTFGVYVDYNNGKNLDENGKKVLKRSGSASYGEDVEFGDATYQAAGFTIRTESFASTNGNLPSETSVSTGWKVFYVENPDDLNKPENWIEGYNAKNDGTKAYSILIYQAQWMDYSDFLFRVNDTGGKLYCAITKDFKILYWNNDRAATKETAVLNPNEDNIIILYTISFDNGLSFTPFAVNSSLFTIDGIIGLFKALGNAIGGLLGDLFEDIELPSFDFGGGEGEGEGEGSGEGEGEGEGGGIFDFDFNISLPC